MIDPDDEPTAKAPEPGHAEEIDLNEDEEAALDRAWARVDEEQSGGG